MDENTRSRRSAVVDYYLEEVGILLKVFRPQFHGALVRYSRNSHCMSRIPSKEDQLRAVLKESFSPVAKDILPVREREIIQSARERTNTAESRSDDGSVTEQRTKREGVDTESVHNEMPSAGK
ncbi:hypothetical protein TNCV_2037941 [Trichonephila clavipes]|nr:hypothetical protein TNCV_2037941 [Trichonephila clavipes]